MGRRISRALREGKRAVEGGLTVMGGEVSGSWDGGKWRGFGEWKWWRRRGISADSGEEGTMDVEADSSVRRRDGCCRSSARGFRGGRSR